MNGKLRVAMAVCSAALVPATAMGAGTVTAVGTSQVSVSPANRNSEASIRKAVEKAYERAIPAAIADARGDAEIMAKAAGLTLGAIESLNANVVGSPYGPFVFFGRFGPSKYCGKVQVFRRDPATGRRKAVKGKFRRVCHAPPFVVQTIAVTFTTV
jgi:hypothetical protein